MLPTTLKQRLRQVDFLRYGVAPQLRRAGLLWRKLRSHAPQIALVEDLKALAATRGWSYTSVAGRIVQQTMPSKTTPEEAAVVSRQAGRYARLHDRRREGVGRVQQLWFANLSAVSRYPIEETFTCEVPDVFVSAPDGAAITSRYEGLTQAVRLRWDTVVLDRTPGQAERLPGRYASLLGWSVQNYSHWLVDILPRAALIFDRLPELKLLVPERLRSYHYESLELLGVRREQLVHLQPGWHRVEQLLVAHPAQRSMLPSKAHVTALRDRLAAAVFGAEARPQPTRRIYISRSKTRRKILNEQALLPVLREYGFEQVFCEELSLPEQIRLFAEAAVILGPHGSGLNNTIFLPPGGRLIELYNPVRWNYCVRGFANIMGHEHWYMFGENANAEFDMTVDPRRLAKLLDYAFERDTIVESDF